MPGAKAPITSRDGHPLPVHEIIGHIPGDEQTNIVFVEKDGLARRVDVRIIGQAGDLKQITAADASSTLLVPGANIILDYIHFLQDREPVRVVQRRELKL